MVEIVLIKCNLDCSMKERSDAMRTVGLTVGGYNHQEVPLEGMHPVMDDLDRTIAWKRWTIDRTVAIAQEEFTEAAWQAILSSWKRDDASDNKDSTFDEGPLGTE
ncbi:hypothetical protein QJS10_CPA05g01810 [Acorus calamus]|uniref:Uncharacterized protein n=1 Tax=Acorus calamus TaxID=4465 RepID=A0AAV9ERF2_ACOCL|nr:hypothetical protein QJS10_CPA05g01810 [Acorus calamus]